MKIITIENWYELTRTETRSHADQIGSVACPFVGVAIGPESDEARVRVNGKLLQAGRVIALREENYTIERVTGSPGSIAGDAIWKLELILFECVEELACEVARPNHRYPGAHNLEQGTLAINNTPDGSGNPLSKAYFPFVGRRHLFVTIDDVDTAGDIDYRVVGYRWSDVAQAFREYEIVPTVADQPMPIAFHIGGTNEEEIYDVISVDVMKSTAGTGNVVVEAEAVGELGID
jgi:hypothetical protein